MRKIVAGLFLSVDGVMESPESWTGQYMNDEMGQAIGARFAAADSLLLGRVTYQTFAAAFAGGSDPMASQMNSLPKFVVSTTLDTADWQNSTLIKGDVVQEVTRLKQQAGKNIAVSGSGTLVRSLLRHDLLDELNLLVPPIVVGCGKRLFEGNENQRPLSLMDSRTFSTGVLSLTYARAGR